MNMMVEKAKLYVVATPIGNLQDITLRALDVLKQVDVIFAEDTRVTKKLLQQYAIAPPLLYSCHEHNEAGRSSQIVELLSQGKSIALVSDAGTPLISDPGFYLIQSVKENGFSVETVPGACALIAALSIAGLPTDAFSFYGFLPAKPKAKKDKLQLIMHVAHTCIFYESTHRILATLKLISELLPQRKVVVAKELTKQHEQVFEGWACEILAQFEKEPLLCKGEFVILLEGVKAPKLETSETNDDRLLQVLLRHLPIKQAVQIAVEITNGKKNALYKKALAQQNR
ncbi:16S rRNA (cytidine(1402)-2'-O)-methyltransferase [Facilibium subflavum]|uniref:16S rRNA (cytidine(1402)-2'-O)-methyltransferase n=1 Tax=Facilibium subflavum TaxID=2219058 RepID=UPI000E64B20D|nr:16S rRNA (cytidine(1402)-2'-O)-methyltransferase [Facilibium subflavum]